tara:strand:- start:302 stop:451 length:150 start_codon:yes stop_codon:yes gene_type:complete
MRTQADTLRQDIKRLEVVLRTATINNDIALERKTYNELDILKSTLINIM